MILFSKNLNDNGFFFARFLFHEKKKKLDSSNSNSSC